MRSAEIIDAALGDRALVFGSLPPNGRDLDLLVRREQRLEAERALEAAGFLRRAYAWAAFRDCRTDAVELIPVEDWNLGTDEVESLFAHALPIAGFAHLVRPSPHHALLIMARRVARSGGELDAKKRARVAAALREDRDAWAQAQAVAPGWAARRAIVALERLYKTGVPTTRRARVAALSEREPSLGGRLRAWRIVLKRRRGHALFAFSGLDGSGKTSQAEALKDALERTVGETTIVWTRLSYNPSLKALARPVKTLLRPRARGAPRSSGAEGDVDPGKELRRKSAVVTYGWATAVAVANAASQRRVTRYHLKRGRNVVCDRYTLDSRVHLRYRYGSSRRFAFQAWIIAAFSPRPLRAFHVAVPPEVAFRRKAEQYDLAQLEEQARLYDEERHRTGAIRVDGTRAREELCGEIAEEVWRSLG